MEVPLSKDFDLDIEAISEKITKKTKAIIINSPNNPTGMVYSVGALTKLAKIVNENDIFVLSDDIYSKIIFNDKYLPITSFKIKNLLISNSFSKSQAISG